jgi:hypothetical protein
MTTPEKAGLGIGALFGYGLFGLGFWPVAIGAGIGYVVGRSIEPSPERHDDKAGTK